jgi:hypothetical protein
LQGNPSEVAPKAADGDKEDKETEMIMHKIFRIVTSCSVEPVLMLNMMAVALVQVRFVTYTYIKIKFCCTNFKLIQPECN